MSGIYRYIDKTKVTAMSIVFHPRVGHVYIYIGSAMKCRRTHTVWAKKVPTMLL